MNMPQRLIRFLTPAQWQSLGLDRLAPEDGMLVVDLLLKTFEGEDPGEITSKELDQIIRHVRTLSDDLQRGFEADDSLSREEVASAIETARDVLRDLRSDGKGGEQDS